MKARRLIMILLAFSLFFSATVFADSLWGTYEGYQKAKVFVNNTEVVTPEGGVPAFVINGSTVLPLRQVAENLQALVKWDNTTKTANIYKPNVHMFIAKDVDSKDYSIKQPFGKVAQGDSMSFVVFTQVDSLKGNEKGFKISIENPNGELVDSHVVPLDKQTDSFWYPWPFNNVKFSQKGNYTVKLSFLMDDGYTVVSQKLIVSE